MILQTSGALQQNENTPVIINKSTLSATSFRFIFKTNLCVDLDLTFYSKILTLKIKMQISNLDFNNMYDLD